MPKKILRTEEIVTKLRQVEVLTGQGRPVAEAMILRSNPGSRYARPENF